MQDKNGLTPAERELELSLAQLQPASTRLVRDRLMFQAGRKAGRHDRRRFLWPAVAAVFAVALGTSMLHRRCAAPPVERVVYVPVPAKAVAAAPADDAPTVAVAAHEPSPAAPADEAAAAAPAKPQMFLLKFLSEHDKDSK